MNLEDIARLSGFSRSTVSRVVNNDLNVRESTRQRVMEVIQTTNYSPNLAARSLAVGRTQTLAVVVPMAVASLFSDPYYPILIQGISAACNTLDYFVMLWLAEPKYDHNMMRRTLDSGLVDGVLVAAAVNDDPVLHALRASAMPFVTVGRLPNHAEAGYLDNYVDVDNCLGAFSAVMHLLRLGRRRIACIRSPLNTGVGSERFIGYGEALAQWGIPLASELVSEGDFSEMSGYVAMQRLLPAKPDALFAFNDNMAVGALRALREAGLQTPRDIAVVGFDDAPFSAHVTPPLTTVRQPTEQVGQLAAEMLIEIAEQASHPASQAARTGNHESPRRVILPTELVIRQSCGLT